MTDFNKISCELAWAKFRDFYYPTYCGGETLAISSESLISFTNVLNGTEKVYRASGNEFGDGVSCIAGHRTVPIFAFAESCVRPRILVLTYPEFKRFKLLYNEHKGAYRQLSFSDGEYLVALCGMPEFKLEIWNWRSGKLLIVQETGLISHDQALFCNRANYLVVAQYAKDLGEIMVWEAHISIDNAFLIKRPMNLSFATTQSKISLTFGVDNVIYVADKDGNFYSVSTSSGNVKELWKWKGANGNDNTHINFYKGGFVIAGSQSEVVYLKQLEGIWTEMWKMRFKDKIYYMRVLAYNMLCCIRDNATIDRLNDVEEKREFIQVKDSHRFVKFFEFLRPTCNFVITVSDYNEIRLLDIESGDIISSVELKYISCIDSHPTYPLVLIGDQKGVIRVLSFYNTKDPIFLSEFNLSAHWIVRVAFTSSGKYVVVCDRIGDFFIMTGIIRDKQQQLEILAHFSHEDHIFDYCVCETEDCLTLLILCATVKDKNIEVSSKILNKIIVTKNGGRIEKSKIDLLKSFTSITSTKIVPKKVIATEYMSRDIHVLKLDDNTFNIEETLKTVNQFNYVRIHCDGRYIIAWGMDGIVSIFNLTTKLIEVVCLAHNRISHGIKHVKCDSFRKYFVSLGFKGNLYCFRMTPNYADETEMKQISDLLSGAETIKMLTNPIPGFKPEGEHIGKTWLEMKDLKEYERECKKYAVQKENIYKDFKTLQQKLKELIDKNADLDEIERLQLQQFNLNKDWSENIAEQARVDRELEDRTLKAKVADQNRITKWIIQNTWEQMSVKGCKVRGLFSNVFCENYALQHENLAHNTELKHSRFHRWIEKFVADKDSFHPWAVQNQNQLDFMLLQPPQYSVEEWDLHVVRSRTTSLGSEAAQSISDQSYALSGTGTHSFIDPFPLRYDQLEVVSYQQMVMEDAMGQCDMLNLRLFFNKKFDEVKKLKEEELRLIMKRNETRKYNQSELNLLAKLRKEDSIDKTEIIDPKLTPDEQPESIIKVEEWEIQAKPYISPSMQKMLEEKAYQAEQRRLALLADDFRKRALMKMMDGVLERKWADEIKKDPPIPSCVADERDQTEYTVEDAKEVKAYEDIVKELAEERERYRKQLENEQIKLKLAQSDQIKKFNTKCSELSMLKYQVDAAIKQEEIKLLRNRLYNQQRIVLKRKHNGLREELIRKKNEVEDITQMIEELEKRVFECRNRYEQIQTKDKMLEKQFKTQFSEFAPHLAVDQACKIFKRRPKWQQKVWATHTILYDMAHRVQTRNSSRTGPPLPEECYEFLALIESVEIYSNAPNTIDQNLWGILCKMRRVKIESEFKLKSCGAQLTEAEFSLNTFIRELNSKKNSLATIEKEIEDLKHKYTDNLMNRTVQLVMPRGIVEVPLTGHISDFENAVLLDEEDIGEINSIIKKAGQRKLQTMTNSAVFRRKIIHKEWEHKVLRMNVQDLKESLNVIENCKVTKEIQMWLKRKKEGRADDFIRSAVNREMEATQKHLNVSLSEINKKIKNVEMKLKARKNENNLLDKKIQALNVDVTAQNLLRDERFEDNESRKQKERMQMIVERGKLVRKVQSQHALILELATLLELQKLRTFPTLTSSSLKTTST